MERRQERDGDKGAGRVLEMEADGPALVVLYYIVVVEFNSKRLYSSSSLSAFTISLKSSII